MQISDILHEKGTTVVTIDANRSIHDAINVLTEHRIGSLIVTGESEEVVGIITERDILRICGDRCNNMKVSSTSAETVCSCLVQDAMTKDLVSGVPDDDPNYAMAVMTKNHIRHLPIMAEGNLAGIISIGDLVNAHLEEKVLKSGTLKEYISRNSEPKALN